VTAREQSNLLELDHNALMPIARKNRLLEGIAASPGIVMGPAHVLTQEGQVATRLLYNDQEVAVDFGALGLWLRNGTQWSQLSSQNPESITAGRSPWAMALWRIGMPGSYCFLVRIWGSGRKYQFFPSKGRGNGSGRQEGKGVEGDLG